MLHHLLTGLVLLAGFAHKTILASPCPATPKIRRQLVASSLDSARPSAIGLFTLRIRLLDGHVGIAKTNDLGLSILTGADYALLTALYVTTGLVARKLSGIHLPLR